MKKENRKLAQEQKAETKKKQVSQKKVKKQLSSVIPNIVVVIVFMVIVYAVISASNEGKESNHQVTEQYLLQTDTELIIADGDLVNVDFTGTIDGEEFEGSSTNGEGKLLYIGSGYFLQEFEQQLIGYHPGDEVEITVTFPADYEQEALRGKTAVYTVTVNGIVA